MCGIGCGYQLAVLMVKQSTYGAQSVQSPDLLSGIRGSSQKFSVSTCCTIIFSTIYTSVKRTSFTNFNESVVVSL